MNWSTPERIEPRGHRIFQEIGSSERWAIADNTGPTPDLSEGGVLWIERDIPIRIDCSPDGIQGTLWVWSVRQNRGTRVILKIEGALFLVRKLRMKVNFASSMRPLLELVDASGYLGPCLAESLRATSSRP